MTKTRFNVLFIVFSAAILMTLNYLGLMEEFVTYALILLMIAYYLGQYSEKKYGEKKE